MNLKKIKSFVAKIIIDDICIEENKKEKHIEYMKERLFEYSIKYIIKNNLCEKIMKNTLEFEEDGRYKYLKLTVEFFEEENESIINYNKIKYSMDILKDEILKKENKNLKEENMNLRFILKNDFGLNDIDDILKNG